MSTNAYCSLMFDAPFQSWGFNSRFQRRTTGLYPTKSGVLGMICAAMGVAKGSDLERDILPKLAALKMMSIAMPRPSIPIRRHEDFHTVLGTRTAGTGKIKGDAVITRRQYLLDARFGIILEGNRVLLEQVISALHDPVWGIWFGRKNCIPAASIPIGVYVDKQTAWIALLRMASLDVSLPVESFTRMIDIDSFEEGTDSYSDQPVSFGDGKSSGPDARVFSVRRINLEVGASG